MFFSLELLLLSLPFMTSYAAAQSIPLKFLYPVPGKFNYEFVDGDKAIVEWTPRIQLSQVLLNCSSSAIFNGATDSEIEFLNAKSGVLYHVRQTEDDGDSRSCTFCAGPDSQTCSGVFRLTPRTKGLVPKVWTLDGNNTSNPSRSSSWKPSSIVSSTTSLYSSATIIPISSRNTSSSYPTPRPSSNNSTTPSSPTFTLTNQTSTSSTSPTPTFPLPYGYRNTSATSWNLTSLPPSFSLPTASPLPTKIIIDTSSSPSAGAPYTTITASLQGWNATAFNANGNGATTIVISVTPSTRVAPTASIVSLPSATPTPSAGWRTSVDFMMVGLGFLAVGVFLCL